MYPYADYDVYLTLSSWDGDPQFAAPVQGEKNGDSVVYRVSGVRAFALAALYDFKQVTQTDEGVTYTVNYQTVSEQIAQKALATMRESVHLYAQMFGPYPFDSLTMTELEMFDGMEFDAQFFLSKVWFHTYDGTPKNNLVLLTAHETAHNWWFSQVGNDQAFDPWLDEALCVYSELLYLEAYHPELVDWWWDFRVYNFEPAGPVNVSIYDFVQYENYRQAVYLRGAEFIQAVRDVLGDGQFFTFLQHYLAEGHGKVMSTEDFFRILGEINPEAAETLQGLYFGDW
ncbi:MAG: M1 family aminopeptidase [Anaerolineales bacterium]